jgi:hypothetical protein
MAEISTRDSGLRLVHAAVVASVLLPAVLFIWAGWANYKK